MRFLAIVLFGITLLATPAMAAMPAQNSSTQPVSAPAGPHNFGRIICSQHVPCSESADLPTSAYTSSANTCITENFGYSSTNGFFDEAAGLDSNNCLTAKPNVLPKGMGTPLTPQCCITKLPDNSCTFRCELNTVQ